MEVDQMIKVYRQLIAASDFFHQSYTAFNQIVRNIRLIFSTAIPGSASSFRHNIHLPKVTLLNENYHVIATTYWIIHLHDISAHVT